MSQTYRVSASNALGYGTVSSTLTLTPGNLPGAPATLVVSSYGENYLVLTWTSPTDTGYGSTTATIVSYLLEVNDGFTGSYQTLSEQTAVTYSHQSLIVGHTYNYRVKAKNYLGYGTYSAVVSGTPRRVPGQPTSSPNNVAASTTATVIYISYDIVHDNGGSAITYYNVYMDDGLGGSYSAAVNNGLLLTYSTSALTLTSGRTYRFKYSGVNSVGEGAASAEVSILAATVPGVPASLARVVNSSINAGDVVISWSSPTNTGGVAITGYRIYLQGVIYADGISPAITTASITQLTVGSSYTISVSAINAVGEGTTASITVVAAGVPSQLSAPSVTSSTTSSITLTWNPPSFNGGSPVTSYLIKRDDGPQTSYQTAVSVATTSYTFSSLSSSTLYYRIVVTAVNAIGQGDYSVVATYLSAGAPSVPLTFVVSSQSVTEIDLSWAAPSSNGGCSVEGYVLYMESVDSPGFSIIFDGRTSAQITSYSVLRPTISSSKSYIFALQSKNCGYYSSNVTVTATAASVPSAPSGVAMTTAVSTTIARVGWNVPSSDGGLSISGYNVYVNNVAFASLTGTSTTTVDITGLTLGTTYKIQVTAVNSAGESAKSTTYYLLFANPPGVPTSLALASTISTLTVSWVAPSSYNGDAVRGYKVYLDDGNGGPITLAYDGSSLPQTLKA